jgi:hypothetical protein
VHSAAATSGGTHGLSANSLNGLAGASANTVNRTTLIPKYSNRDQNAADEALRDPPAHASRYQLTRSHSLINRAARFIGSSSTSAALQVSSYSTSRVKCVPDGSHIPAPFCTVQHKARPVRRAKSQ